jgi:Putative peptidoglycan binding domain
MRKLLTLACCFGLAVFTASAQPNNNQNQQRKKKGGNAPQQPVTTAPAKVHGTQHYNANLQGQGGIGQQHYKKGNALGGQTNMGTNLNSSKSNKFKQGTNQTNVSNAASTKFNKTNVNKNLTVNKNFQKQKFNLQTNNKQVVINKYKTVNYNANYRIAGAGRWGPRYAVFVNYSPAWHDTWWWNWHYGSHIVFIYGGWYYWNDNYWYPAWGYAPDSVYVWDGPIYASNPADDPAQVVANVQNALHAQKDENGDPLPGYYGGDIDGVLGPQTRAALADYQQAHGLEPTGAVDQPTLETLGMT